MIYQQLYVFWYCIILIHRKKVHSLKLINSLIFQDASDEFFRSMKNARCFRTELFSVQPYPAWLIDRIGVFHFIFQSSSELGIHISIQSTKKVGSSCLIFTKYDFEISYILSRKLGYILSSRI